MFQNGETVKKSIEPSNSGDKVEYEEKSKKPEKPRIRITAEPIKKEEVSTVEVNNSSGDVKSDTVVENIPENTNNVDSVAEVKSDASNQSSVSVNDKQHINIENNHHINLYGEEIPKLNNRAKSRFEHIAKDMETPVRAKYFMGELYEQAVINLRNGHFRVIGEVEAAKEIQDFVNENLASKIKENTTIYKELTPDNKRYYYVIRWMLYIEAIEKLKNNEFGAIKRSDLIAKAIDDFVNKKLISYID